MTSITTAVPDQFIQTADKVLFLAWKHAGGQHVCDRHAPIVWDMAMLRAKSALQALTACTAEQADEALDLALELDYADQEG